MRTPRQHQLPDGAACRRRLFPELAVERGWNVHRDADAVSFHNSDHVTGRTTLPKLASSLCSRVLSSDLTSSPLGQRNFFEPIQHVANGNKSPAAPL